MWKSSRASGWEVLGSKDRVMVLNTSHPKGVEEVLGEWMLEIKNSEICLLIITRLRIEGMRLGDISGMEQEIIEVKEVKELGA